MPIDASIPLSVKQFQGISPAELLSLKDLQTRSQANQLALADAEQKQQTKNAIRQLLQSPGATDQKGQISPNAIEAVTRLDPQTGFELGKQREQMRLYDVARNDKMDEVRKNVGTSYVLAYEKALQSTGGNKVEAIRQAKEETLASIGEMERSGKLTALGMDEVSINNLKSLPDPDKARTIVTSLGGKLPEVSQSPFEKELAGAGITPGTPEYSSKMKAKVAKDIAPTPAMQIQGQFGGRNGELLAALAEKGVSLPTGFRSKEQQVALLNGLRERNPSLTPDEIADKVKSGQIDLANVKKAGQVAAGVAGKVSYAENEIEQTIPLVREASAKLPRGQFIPFNKLKQMGESAFSDPNLAEFRMYMTSLSNAYDMLAARGGTDVEKRAEARRNFETAQSPEALEAVLKAVQKEAKASGRAATQSMKGFAGTKEPERATSKSGRPMHKNADGKWEYD